MKNDTPSLLASLRNYHEGRLKQALATAAMHNKVISELYERASVLGIKLTEQYKGEFK